MSSLSIGLSALSVSQQLLDLTGQNIANANTPGFHRQIADLAARTAGQPIGAGVEIQQVRRLVNNLLEAAITQNTVSASDAAAQLQAMQQLEAGLDTGDGSIPDLLEKFFNQLSTLMEQPGDVAQRRVMLVSARALTDRLNASADDFRRLRQDADTQGAAIVDQVNLLTDQIARLNASIHNLAVQGGQPNDLMDRRDQLVQQLAQYVDVRVVNQDFGQVNVLAGGVPVVLGNQAVPLQWSRDAEGQAVVSANQFGAPLNVAGGQVGAMLTLYNKTLPDIQHRLDALADAFIQQVDTLQATGLGLDGPKTFLAGTRAVSSADQPLAQARFAYPPQQGSLFISVTDLATGQRSLHEIAIDPTQQTLRDVANAISAIPHVQALIDDQGGTLKVVAQAGYGFDFAGRVPAAPDLALTGSTVPAISGTYTGAANERLTYRVAGSGTIGTTAGLTLAVYNSGNQLLGSFNIGQGYEAGTVLGDIQGVRVQLGAGTVNDGDSFSVAAVAEPDSAHLLTALGLNTFFTGSGAGDVKVRQVLLDHPEVLAASVTGQPGDGANLARMIAVRDAPLLANGSQTLGQFFADTVGMVASQIQELNVRKSALEGVGQRLQDEQQSLSGVDPNEELVRMLQFQRAFQMSARFISVVNDTMDDLLHLA